MQRPGVYAVASTPGPLGPDPASPDISPPRLGGRETGRARLFAGPRRSGSRPAAPGRSRRQVGRLPQLSRQERCADDACDAGRAARLHRLPRRQSRHSRRSAARLRRSSLCVSARPRACAAALSRRLALPVLGQSPAQLCPAQQGSAGIHPFRQSRRLPRRPRSLRRLPSPGDRGGRALADGLGRHAVGRRGLQQRHRAVQELHLRRELHPQRRAGESDFAGQSAGRADRRTESARRSIRCRAGT